MRKAAIYPLFGLLLSAVQPASADIGTGILGRLGAQPPWTAGIAHSVIMRGQVIDIQKGEPVVCLGSADGAKVGQIFEVYRINRQRIEGKTPSQVYGRDLIGRIRIDHIFNNHFSHAVVTAGSPAVHDVVELHL